MVDEEDKALTPQEPYRKPSKRKALVGKGQGSPHHAAKSVANSYTSPRAIHRQKRKLEALGLREAGNSFSQIAAHMKCGVATVHAYVTEALRELPQETAAEVLRMELQRLDALFAAFYDSGAGGDLPSASMSLQIIEKRAKLLGLYPESGKQQTLGLTVRQGGDAEVPAISLEFVWPGPQKLDNDLIEHRPPVRDVSPKPTEPITIEQKLGPQPSVPLVRPPRKPTDWMG